MHAEIPGPAFRWRIYIFHLSFHAERLGSTKHFFLISHNVRSPWRNRFVSDNTIFVNTVHAPPPLSRSLSMCKQFSTSQCQDGRLKLFRRNFIRIKTAHIIASSKRATLLQDVSSSSRAHSFYRHEPTSWRDAVWVEFLSEDIEQQQGSPFSSFICLADLPSTDAVRMGSDTFLRHWTKSLREVDLVLDGDRLTSVSRWREWATRILLRKEWSSCRESFFEIPQKCAKMWKRNGAGVGAIGEDHIFYALLWRCRATISQRAVGG